MVEGVRVLRVLLVVVGQTWGVMRKRVVDLLFSLLGQRASKRRGEVH